MSSLLRDQINLDDKEPGDLDQMRRNLTNKALLLQKEGKELDDEDLHLLCAVTQSLRRRAVPPKAPKAGKKATKAKPSLADI